MYTGIQEASYPVLNDYESEPTEGAKLINQNYGSENYLMDFNAAL